MCGCCGWKIKVREGRETRLLVGFPAVSTTNDGDINNDAKLASSQPTSWKHRRVISLLPKGPTSEATNRAKKRWKVREKKSVIERNNRVKEGTSSSIYHFFSSSTFHSPEANRNECQFGPCRWSTNIDAWRSVWRFWSASLPSASTRTAGLCGPSPGTGNVK